jgi:hypothetical protein
MIATIANWSDLRRRQELYASMGGAAARVVSDILVEDPTARRWTHVEMEAAYEARFVTQAASDQARADFSRAVQLPEESILEWHSRARDLFSRAYPGADPAMDPAGQMLRDQFTSGLDQSAIKEHVYDSRPKTYGACLDAAQAKTATLFLMVGKSGKSAKGVHAVGSSAASSGNKSKRPSCYFCNNPNHFQRDCPLLNKAKTYFNKSDEGGSTRGGGGGARGAKRGGAKKGDRIGKEGRAGNRWTKHPRAGMNAFGEDVDEEEEEDEASESSAEN